MGLSSDSSVKRDQPRAEYRAAKAALATLTDPESDEFIAANARVVAAEKNLPAWHISKRS